MEAWEGLDVDDSDLSAFLRPCKRPHSFSHSISIPDSPPSNSPPQSQSQSQSQTLIPLLSPSPPPSLIPGPAGAVQAAIMHRRAHTSSGDPLPTQEFIRLVVQNGHQSDHDFTSNAWLSAFHFLRSQGMLDVHSQPPATPLNSVKSLVNLGRVAQIVAVIKSCIPNGFGDMMVTLKDPSGTISASVHHKVFTEGQFGKDITVGSVLILQKVAVFSPTHSSCYLNITLQNIVKVFSKDSGPPSKQIDLTLSARQTTPDIERQEVSRMSGGAFSLPQDMTEGVVANRGLDPSSFALERHEKSRMLGNTCSLPQKTTEGIMTNSRLDSRFLTKERPGKSSVPGNTLSVPQERTEGIMSSLRLDSMFRVVADVDELKAENFGVTSYHFDNGLDRNKNTVQDKRNLSLRQDNARSDDVINDGELEIEMDDQPNHPKLGEEDTAACSAGGTSSSKNTVPKSTGHDTQVKDHSESQREVSNPVSSIPQWTDEQLDELLAFD